MPIAIAADAIAPAQKSAMAFRARFRRCSSSPVGHRATYQPASSMGIPTTVARTSQYHHKNWVRRGVKQQAPISFLCLLRLTARLEVVRENLSRRVRLQCEFLPDSYRSGNYKRSVMQRLDFSELHALYDDLLRHNIIPYWFRHGMMLWRSRSS